MADAADLIHGHLRLDPPEGVPHLDLDPYDEAVLREPAAWHAALRGAGPFVWLTRYGMLACGRHAETAAVFGDHRRFVSSRGVGLSDFAAEAPWRPPSIVLEVDPPYHSKTRAAIHKALSPRAVAAMGEMFAAEAARLARALVARGEADGVQAFAAPFPCTVFPRAMGLTGTDPARLLAYGAMVFNAIGPDNALRRASMAEAPRIGPWLAERCARDAIAPNGLAAALYASADAGEITEEEAGLLVRSLLSAGVDTTVTGLGAALHALAEAPDQFARLRADPGLARGAFEETLRWASPVQAFCRTAAEACEVSGVRIAAGMKVLCVLAAANRDPQAFEDPDRFDIDRNPRKHLAFGTGVHGCVGQAVARAEGEAALRALAVAAARIEPAGTAVWRANNALRGLERLPLRLHSA
ncbi:MAG: cytochrome P450 [Pseudomonadota bacterium]